MSSVSSINTNRNDNKLRNAAIGTAAVVAAWEAEPYLKRGFFYPARNYIRSGMKKVNGGGYLPYLERAIKQNNLEKSFKVLDLNYSTESNVRKTLGMKGKPSLARRVFCHIMRLPATMDVSFQSTLKGENAFFSPKHNAIVCNFDKFGAPAFHEISHKLNTKSSNFLVKTLSKIRNPMAYLGTFAVSAIAVLKDPKKEGEKPEGFTDYVKKYCGLAATGMMLPLTIEECIANVKGTKVAQKAGVTGSLLNKVKKCHKLSVISYCSGAIVTGLAVQAASELRDFICKYKSSDK